MKIGKLKSIKPKIFKFEKGKLFDGDEEIFNYIEDLLYDYDNFKTGDCPRVKQKTYITIMCAKELK